MSAHTVGAKRRAKKARKSVTLADVPGVTVHAPEPVDNAPTPERMAKGDWTVGSATGAFRCTKAIKLYHAHKAGHITAAMKNAGDAYLSLRTSAVKINGGSLQRDSLDFMPRGGGETSPEYSTRIKAKDEECTRALIVVAKDGRPFSLQGWVEAFVVQNTALGPYDLRYRWWQGATDGLRILVGVFGIAED